MDRERLTWLRVGAMAADAAVVALVWVLVVLVGYALRDRR